MRLSTTALIRKQSLSVFILIVTISFSFASVSCANTPTDSLNKDSQKYLSFYETIDGEKIHWEVNFEGDEITSIYKNGKKIPDDLTEDYKSKVYDQLDEMRSGEGMFTFRMPVLPENDFHFDMEEFHKDMEKFREEFSKHKQFFEFHHFNEEEFRKEMEELQKNLEKLNPEDFKIPFDSEKFKEEMKDLEKQLRKFHNNCDEDAENGEV